MSLFKRKTKNSKRIITDHLYRISRLLQQGYSISAALSFMKVHSSTHMKILYEHIEADLNEGVHISEAFSRLGLSKDILSFLYFFERQGNLEEGFLFASKLSQRKERVKKDFMKIIRYPLALIWITLLVVLMLQQVVIPQLVTIYASFSGERPAMTSFLFSVIQSTPYIIACLSFVLVLLFFSYMVYIRPKSSVYQVRLLLKFPHVHQFVRSIITYYFSLQLGRLLESGMAIGQALSVFLEQNYLDFYEGEVKEIQSLLTQGFSFYEIMKAHPYFLTELAFVIDNGEKTGFLGKDLQSYSEILYADIERSIEKFFAVLQPLFFIVIGSFILFLFIAIMLPMFSLFESFSF
ncbi:competence type IV pilus assembly protein ComGB [Alkalihalobacillus pseudalcaliphilus]|uniref:competence type IV pilus assembly protein ComGB n=1 Tax=Alkalihalobacillus pseudalcaliphilus TaxID=79884 RepID=UPI00064DB007|nr:competence type IV pilus assembly protein ComGB [Alkalihalobacillus pseudalcaliphilus]KMK77335.1 hypothetical protein AB990_07280 [Alkalihalobacillus pseudalcaliphilus]